MGARNGVAVPRSQTSPSRPLTGQPLANLRHERFSVGVVSGLNGTQAWLAVSPTTKPAAAAVTANRLLSDAKVLARIAELRAPAMAVLAEQAEDAAGSAAWIASMAVEGVNRAFNAVPVYEMRQGRRVQVDGEWTCNLSAAAPFLSLLAKQHAQFSDKVDARVLHGVVKVERGTRSLT